MSILYITQNTTEPILSVITFYIYYQQLVANTHIVVVSSFESVKTIKNNIF